MVKAVFLTCDSWRVTDDTCQKNTLVQFSLHYNNFVKCSGFWKKQFATTSGWEFTVSPNQDRTGMTVSTHRTLFSVLFSHGMVHCVLRFFIQLGDCMEICFYEPEIWGLIAEALFSLWMWVVAASNLPEKHTGSFFSLQHSQICQACFWKIKAAYHFWLESSDSTISPVQE